MLCLYQSEDDSYGWLTVIDSERSEREDRTSLQMAKLASPQVYGDADLGQVDGMLGPRAVLHSLHPVARTGTECQEVAVRAS